MEFNGLQWISMYIAWMSHGFQWICAWILHELQWMFNGCCVVCLNGTSCTMRAYMGFQWTSMDFNVFCMDIAWISMGFNGRVHGILKKKVKTKLKPPDFWKKKAKNETKTS